MKIHTTKKVFMIAGPNGSGKTTTAHSIMSGTTAFAEYINADEIARGLAPMNPETVSIAASKLMIKRFKELLEGSINFAFETTGAGTNYVKHLTDAKNKGYEVHLIFLWLPTPLLAVERVAARVAQGGHHIPEETIIRRYFSGIKNLIHHYLLLSNTALILDNSKFKEKKVIAKKYISNKISIESPKQWQEMEDISYAHRK